MHKLIIILKQYYSKGNITCMMNILINLIIYIRNYIHTYITIKVGLPASLPRVKAIQPTFCFLLHNSPNYYSMSNQNIALWFVFMNKIFKTRREAESFSPTSLHIDPDSRLTFFHRYHSFIRKVQELKLTLFLKKNKRRNDYYFYTIAHPI